jgi:hypothetical protein
VVSNARQMIKIAMFHIHLVLHKTIRLASLIQAACAIIRETHLLGVILKTIQILA